MIAFSLSDDELFKLLYGSLTAYRSSAFDYAVKTSGALLGSDWMDCDFGQGAGLLGE